MIERMKRRNGRENLLAYRIYGDISKKRMKAVEEDVRRAVVAYGKIRLLILIEPYPDILIGADGLYENLKFVKLHAESIEKLALVSQKIAEKTYAGIFGLFAGIPTEYFDARNLEAARKWAAS